MNIELTLEQLKEMGKLFGKTFLTALPIEDRLEGLSIEERLYGLKLEERLAGLKPEEIVAYLRKLKKQKPRDS